MDLDMDTRWDNRERSEHMVSFLYHSWEWYMNMDVDMDARWDSFGGFYGFFPIQSLNQ